MIEYKIKKNPEETNPLKLTIQKTGEPVEFSLFDIYNSEQFAKKQIAALEGQIKIEEAKMANVERTHAHIAEMSEEDRMACYIYQGSFAIASASKRKIKEFNEQLEEYRKEKAEIAAQTGINSDEELKKQQEATKGGTAISPSSEDKKE